MQSGLSAAVRGSESGAMIHVTDWLPTLCEVAGCAGGGTPVGTKPLDGISAWAAIAQGGAGNRTEFLISLTEVMRLQPGHEPAMSPNSDAGSGGVVERLFAIACLLA